MNVAVKIKPDNRDLIIAQIKEVQKGQQTAQNAFLTNTVAENDPYFDKATVTAINQVGEISFPAKTVEQIEATNKEAGFEKHF